MIQLSLSSIMEIEQTLGQQPKKEHEEEENKGKNDSRRQEENTNFVEMDLKDSMAGIDDGKYVIYKQDDLFSESFPVMKEIRRQGKLCDVTLKVIRYLFLETFIQKRKNLILYVPVVQIEDQSFSAHRIVLASTIPYFYAMFTHNMAESRIKEITMKEIEPQYVSRYIDSQKVNDDDFKCFHRALESLINFAYSGMVKIDNQNVQSLMMGSAFLQLNKVRDACANFLISR